MRFEDTLAEWIPTQRWFAGKGARILDLAIVADTELAGGDPGLRHLIIDVSQGSSVDSYQVFAGLREHIPGRLEHPLTASARRAAAPRAHTRGGPEPAVGGRAGAAAGAAGLTAYDALHDPELTRLL